MIFGAAEAILDAQCCVATTLVVVWHVWGTRVNTLLRAHVKQRVRC